MGNLSIHPDVDNGLRPKKEGFSGGTLMCNCTTDRVEVQVDNAYLFNHLCGCTMCWKPKGAFFSELAVVPKEKIHVTRHEEKLKIVNPKAALNRYACTGCGAHMYSLVPNADHVFHPFAFIHPDLSRDKGYDPPGFAAFVSSAIEAGVPPDQMEHLRAHLRELGMEPYDCLSPTLMDLIATHAAKARGTLRESL